MASQFYSRYIPPISIDVDADEVFRPVKKRKKSKSKGNIPPKQGPLQPSLEADTAKQVGAPDAPAPEAELSPQDRHQKVLSKYGKAARKSTESGKEHVTGEGDEPMTKQVHEVNSKFHGLEPLPQPDPVEPGPKVSTFSALPEWLQNPTTVSSTASLPLTDLPIDEKTLSSLQRGKHQNAFAIQAAILPMLLLGPKHYAGDICISAATGSGKTLAYVLPMTEALRDKPVTSLRGLVVVPTRELVEQAKGTLDLCSNGASLKIGSAVGSTSLKEEQALLIHKGQKYDPEGYRAMQEKGIDEDEELMDWDLDKLLAPEDDVELFHNHIVEYTSKVDILICTPGRLVEHIQSTPGFDLQHVQWLVIDEADRLLDESFQQWTDVVLPCLEYMPPLDPVQERISNNFHLLRRRELRKVILSATMTRDVSKLTPLKLRRPRLVILEGQTSNEVTKNDDEFLNIQAEGCVQLPSTLREIGIKVPDSNDKPLYLIQAIESSKELVTNDKVSRIRKTRKSKPEVVSDSEESPLEDSNSPPDFESSSSLSFRSELRPASTSPAFSSPKSHGALIFTKTNEHATRLARLLSLIRPDWSCSIATLAKSSGSSRARKILSSFQKGKISILIASDRASRGLDIPNLAQVINYDMPTSLISYIHRVGRTARAGKEGKATTLIAENEARWFWNEIARSEKVGRGPGRKVVRDNMKYEFSDDVRRRYEQALEAVGKEARG